MLFYINKKDIKSESHKKMTSLSPSPLYPSYPFILHGQPIITSCLSVLPEILYAHTDTNRHFLYKRMAVNNTLLHEQTKIQNNVYLGDFPPSVHRASLPCLKLHGICHFVDVSHLIYQSSITGHLHYFQSFAAVHNLVYIPTCTSASPSIKPIPRNGNAKSKHTGIVILTDTANFSPQRL